jgi:hypothetical protein
VNVSEGFLVIVSFLICGLWWTYLISGYLQAWIRIDDGSVSVPPSQPPPLLLLFLLFYS